MDRTGPEPWVATRDAVRDGVSRVRDRTRGLLLPLFTWPLLPDMVVEIVKGNARGVVAAGLGLGLPLLAVQRLRRGRRGDTQRAAILTGVATGLVAGIGADYAGPMAVLLGAGAWLGTRLLYDGAVQEVEPPAPPAPPPPPGPLDEARLRLTRVQGAADRLHDDRLKGVAGAIAGVLDDLEQRPERLTLARRFLNVHLDGLERIADRLEAGAAPPPGLPVLLEDLQRAAAELRGNLRREETTALEVQVKVLSDRLREEGYR